MSQFWNQEGIYGLICFWREREIRVPLKEIHTNVIVRGFIADVESSLIYYNGNSEPIETRFVFPMEDKSAVYKFEAYIEDRHIVAECKEKNKAEKIYNRALLSGQTAMLMSEDKQAGDIFEIKLGNLPPYTEAKLTLAYVTELPVEPKGTVVFTLPTVLNPRYSPVCSSSAPSVPSIDSNKYVMTFSTRVVGDYVLRSVTSLKDKFTIEQPDGATSAIITLAEPFTFDHDLTLKIQYEDVYRPQIIMEKGSTESEGILKEDVLMLNFFPNFENAPTIKGEYVFIIDRSGSMCGSRIKKAAETLLLLIKSLPADSKFNIIGYGSTFKPLFEKSKTYNADTLRNAKNYQSNLDASMGGTEILQPLKFVYSKKLKPSYSRQIFLLTDGEVSNTRDVIALVKSNAKNTRVFTFGIGSGASTALIENVAAVSSGKATFVKDNERLQAKVMSVMKCAMQPSVTDVTLQWKLPAGVETINLPRDPPAIFKGEKLVLYALIKGKTKKLEDKTSSLILRGYIGGETLYYKLEFSIKQRDICDNLPIHRLVAKAQIKDLENSETTARFSRSTNQDLIILLSTSANIVSKYTAFVGVDKTKKEKSTDLFWLLSKAHDVSHYDTDSSSSDEEDSESDDWDSDDDNGLSIGNKLRPPCAPCQHMGYAPPTYGSGPRAASGARGHMPPSPSQPPNTNEAYDRSRLPSPPLPLMYAINSGRQMKQSRKSQPMSKERSVPKRRLRAPAAPPPPESMSRHFGQAGAQPPPPPPPPSCSLSGSFDQQVAQPPPPPPPSGSLSRSFDGAVAQPPPPPPPPGNVAGPTYQMLAPPPPPPPGNVAGPTNQILAPPPPPPPPASAAMPSSGVIMDKKMMLLIEQQEFDGSWKFDGNILLVFNCSEEEIKNASKTKNIDVWITALAVAWLRIYQKRKEEEWELLEQKAVTWIKSQETDCSTAEQIIDAAIWFLQNTANK